MLINTQVVLTIRCCTIMHIDWWLPWLLDFRQTLPDMRIRATNVNSSSRLTGEVIRKKCNREMFKKRSKQLI